MQFAHFSHVWAKRDMLPAQRFEQLMRELELCDELAFDYAFCVEHHFTPHESWMPSPSLLIAAAASRTRRLRLGPMGYVAPLHQPLRLVEEIAVLDQMTGGRLEMGVVPGITPYFFEAFRADFLGRKEWTREWVEMARTAYRAEGEFEFAGKHLRQDPVELGVRPLQRPHPPIWWDSRDPETLEYLAREGIHTGYFVLMPRREVAPRYREFLRMWNAHGHAERPRMGYWSLVFVDETDQRALATALPQALDAYSLFFSIGKGASQENTAALFEQRGEHGAAELVRNLTDPDYILDHDLVFIGSPDTVARKIEAAARDGFFNTLFCELNFGELREVDVLRSIRLMGEEVIPRLRSFDVAA